MYIQRILIALASIIILASCGSRKKTTIIAPSPDTLVAKPIEPKPWSAPRGQAFREEMRAVWLTTAYGLDWPRHKADTPYGIRQQKEELDRILDRLKHDGYNTVFFQTRQSGSVSYPSAYEPFSRVFTSDGSAPDYDPLAYAIEACHKRGLAIHAWLVTYPLTSPRKSPHPLVSGRAPFVLMHKGGRHLDPGHPEARAYVTKIAEEVASSYAVDGLHFDYFRYPEDADAFRDQSSFARYNPQGLSFSEWRRDNLTKQLESIRLAIGRINPNIQISVAPLGKLRKIHDLGRPHGWTAYESVYQDVETWAERGLVDFVAPMMYYKDDLYEPFLKDWMASVGRYIPVIPGLAPYRIREQGWSEHTIIDQIHLARKYGAGGVAMFREANIGHREPELRSMIQSEFAPTALPLVVPRRGVVAPSRPYDLTVRTDGSKLILSWKMGASDRLTYRVWARIREASGAERDMLVVQGIRETECALRLSDFTSEESLELGVEAVNSFGMSAPCLQAVMYDFREKPLQ